MQLPVWGNLAVVAVAEILAVAAVGIPAVAEIPVVAAVGILAVVGIPAVEVDAVPGIG